MKAKPLFFEKIDAFKATINALPDIVDTTCIQQTARRLEGLHFSPILILPAKRFLYFSKADMLEEIDRVAKLTEQELQQQGVVLNQERQEVKLEQIGLLVYHFKLLTRLRQDDPRAWDEIDELYGDD